MGNHFHNYTEKTLQYSKKLRKEMTPFEEKLWYFFRAKRFFNLKFRRQVPIGNYIADFVCKSKMLIIELDGSGHLENSQAEYDIIRDNYFNNLGYKVIRIFNNDIENNIDGVLEHIKNSIT